MHIFYLVPTDSVMLNLQYVELVFNAYEKYYIYSAVLVTITLLSGVWAVKAQYEKRMNLYNTVQQKRVMPIVFAGTVRYASAAVYYALSVHVRQLADWVCSTNCSLACHSFSCRLYTNTLSRYGTYVAIETPSLMFVLQQPFAFMDCYSPDVL